MSTYHINLDDPWFDLIKSGKRERCFRESGLVDYKIGDTLIISHSNKDVPSYKRTIFLIKYFDTLNKTLEYIPTAKNEDFLCEYNKYINKKKYEVCLLYLYNDDTLQKVKLIEKK